MSIKIYIGSTSYFMISFSIKIVFHCLSKVRMCNAIHLNSLHYTLKWITWNYDNDDYSRVQNMRSQMPNAHLIISLASLYLHYFHYILFPSLELLRAFMLCKARDVEHTLTFSVCVCFFHASHLSSEKNGKFYNWDTIFVCDNCH